MKKFLQFSLLALSAVTTLQAQTKHRFNFKDHRNYGATPAAKTTALNASRCIAQVYAVYDGTSTYNPIDSQTFAYSGTRGGVVTGNMCYDSSLLVTNSGSSYHPTGRYYQTFDSHNNILTNIEQQYDISLSSFVNSARITRTYDANDNILTELNEYWDVSLATWVNSFKTTNTFATPHLLTTSNQMYWSGSAWNNSEIDTFSYNSFNNPTLRFYMQWNSGTSSWDTGGRDTYAYDGSQNLTSIIYEYWSPGTGFMNGSKELYSNYAAPKCYQKFILQNWNMSSSNFENIVKDSITYNTYNQPTFAYERSWDGAAWPLDSNSDRVQLYYELYTNKVSNINSEATAIEVYPNPATEIINIDFTLTDRSNTTIALQDVTGRTIRTTNSANLNNGRNHIQYPVSGLAPGVYFIHLTNDNANIIKRIVIGG